MSAKTITVTEDAYTTLRAMKEPRESFSETILRIAKRKPLGAFYGVLSKESGERLEKSILETRKMRNESHRARLKRIVTELKD
jgi:predicted CopG family antitoxin